MKRKPTFTTSIGSISGLYPEEDLIGDLAYELRSLLKTCRVDRETRKVHIALVRDATDNKRMQARNYVSELFDALEHYTPPYCYFGERQNDRDETEYGFWPCDMEDQVQAGYIIKVDAGDDGREHWGEDVLLVNDHGNVECGRFDKRGRWHEYWSCV